MRIHLGDKSFRKEINALDLADYARDEAYKLIVSRKGIDIYALSETGVFRAQTSLRMMLDSDSTLTVCGILDYPRFSHRGVMLDISRNFRDKAFIMKQLDAMSAAPCTCILPMTPGGGSR